MIYELPLYIFLEDELKYIKGEYAEETQSMTSKKSRACHFLFRTYSRSNMILDSNGHLIW